MKKISGGIVLGLLFIVSVYCSFYFENAYEKAIRKLYVVFTNGNITFFIPKKYFHFASEEFVIAFGLFITVISFLLYRQNRKQRVLNLLFGVVLLLVSSLVFCYCDGWLSIIGCTTCNDGTIKMYYSDIDYDKIFIISLLIALVPASMSEIRQLRQRYGREKPNMHIKGSR